MKIAAIGRGKIRKLLVSVLSNEPTALVAQGAKVYDDNACGFCHGMDAIRGGRQIPDLRASSQEAYAAMREIFDGGYRAAGMPAFKNITDEDIIALQAYLTDQAWKGYENQQSASKK